MSQKPAPPRMGPSPVVATPWPLAVGLLVVLSATAPVPAAEAETDPVLAAAPERIRKHRTGPVTVKVVDRTGKPVAGAEVLLRQRRHEFLFGCNVFLFGRAGSPQDEETYRARFAELLNYATLPFYWGAYEPERGAPSHADRERAALWCREQGIGTKGHPLVWNHRASVPRWLPDDALEIRKLSDARVTDCVSRFRGLIEIWDVVNEATDPLRFRPDNKMTDAFEKIGVTEWTVSSFLLAREANPKATLLINDYRVDEDYAKLISALVHEERPVYDVIGIQSHMHGGAWPPARTWQVCERFARFGVPLHFTETTIVSGRRAEGDRWGPTEPDLEEVQARDVVRFYTTLFSHPAVEAITWWDFSDRRAWQGAPAGFLRADLSPKPAYVELKKLIRQDWWTEATAVTDASGEATVAAFFGEHEVRARGAGKETAGTVRHARKEGKTRVELRLEP